MKRNCTDRCPFCDLVKKSGNSLSFRRCPVAEIRSARLNYTSIAVRSGRPGAALEIPYQARRMREYARSLCRDARERLSDHRTRSGLQRRILSLPKIGSWVSEVYLSEADRGVRSGILVPNTAEQISIEIQRRLAGTQIRVLQLMPKPPDGVEVILDPISLKPIKWRKSRG